MNEHKLSRMERVLLHIIYGLKVTTSLGPYGRNNAWGSEHFEIKDMPGPRDHYVHFAPWHEYDRTIEPGMIVMCETSGISRWKIAEVVQVLGHDRCLLRDLNDGSLCDMGNEAFTPIIGLDPSALLTDDQIEFRRKVIKAFGQLDHIMHRYGGLEFAEEHATIWVRERYGGVFRDKKGSVPYSVVMQWGKRTTIKSIKETLLENGYGKREFETKEAS